MRNLVLALLTFVLLGNVGVVAQVATPRVSIRAVSVKKGVVTQEIRYDGVKIRVSGESQEGYGVFRFEVKGPRNGDRWVTNMSDGTHVPEDREGLTLPATADAIARMSIAIHGVSRATVRCLLEVGSLTPVRIGAGLVVACDK